MTMCGCIALTLASGRMRPLPLCPPHTSFTTSVPTVRPACASRSGEPAGGVTWPCAPSAVPTCRHRSPHVGTICRWSPWRGPSQSSLPAAQAVMPRTVAGGHQAVLSIGTEHATCQTGISALQQVALPVMSYGCSRDLGPQACAMRSRPARSCGSHTKVRRIAGLRGVSKAPLPRLFRPQSRDSTWANLANAPK